MWIFLVASHWAPANEIPAGGHLAIFFPLRRDSRFISLIPVDESHEPAWRPDSQFSPAKLTPRSFGGAPEGCGALKQLFTICAGTFAFGFFPFRFLARPVQGDLDGPFFRAPHPQPA